MVVTLLVTTATIERTFLTLKYYLQNVIENPVLTALVNQKLILIF